MANDEIADPNNVPGAEGHLPVAGEVDARNLPDSDDPALYSTEDDGSDGEEESGDADGPIPPANA